MVLVRPQRCCVAGGYAGIMFFVKVVNPGLEAAATMEALAAVLRNDALRTAMTTAMEAAMAPVPGGRERIRHMALESTVREGGFASLCVKTEAAEGAAPPAHSALDRARAAVAAANALPNLPRLAVMEGPNEPLPRARCGACDVAEWLGEAPAAREGLLEGLGG